MVTSAIIENNFWCEKFKVDPLYSVMEGQICFKSSKKIINIRKRLLKKREVSSSARST